MSSRLVCLFLSGLALLTLTNPAHSETLEATSHVASATIFSDRAIVTREAKLHIPAGTHTVSVGDMPAGFDEASIRVQGKSTAAIKLGTIEVKHMFITAQANPTERQKTEALEARTDDKAFLEGEIAALRTREAFINRIVTDGAEGHDKEGRVIMDFAPEKWVAALKLLQSEMTETQKQLTTKAISLRKIDDEITKLQNELNEVRTTQAKERREVLVHLDSDRDSDLDLTLSYQTRDATWRSIYDARLDTTTAALDLEQYGQVTQQSGEDWTDIDLTLSTAQPGFGSEMPRMNEWWVRLFRPVAQAYDLAGNAGGLARAADVAKAKKAMPMAAPLAMATNEPAEERKEAAQEQALVQASEYAADFRVPGRVSIKSVREGTKVFVGAVHMKAQLAAEVSARLAPQAYLFAKITNGQTYPLISGTVAKYRDGTFIGNAPLALLRAGETADLSFGVDDRVKVTYRQIHEEQTSPALIVVGDMKTERQTQTKVENLHKDPIAITVFEQYPVSEDAGIKVELMEDVTTPGFKEDLEKRQGVIAWSETYAPKEEKTLILGFRVKYPKGSQITGL
ncbi:MAG: mucoidy inhibitor MuiA family protein [Pseudomonadota bacterium]|nr:mucoidy inhibitor MuiA family protein [Pseudomonadota bacterium]